VLAFFGREKHLPLYSVPGVKVYATNGGRKMGIAKIIFNGDKSID
jgi:hypothetical protein